MPMLVLRRCTLILGLVAGLAGCLMVQEDKVYESLVTRDKSQWHVYKLYPGERRPESELAIVLLNDVPSVTVDGFGVLNNNYQEIHLRPGRHSLTLRKVFGFSVMVEPAMEKVSERKLEVELKAGRKYKLFADRTYGAGYRIYFWITDADTGEVIGGLKKP